MAARASATERTAPPPRRRSRTIRPSRALAAPTPEAGRRVRTRRRRTDPGRNSNPPSHRAELRSPAPPVGPIPRPRRGSAGAISATLPDDPGGRWRPRLRQPSGQLHHRHAAPGRSGTPPPSQSRLPKPGAGSARAAHGTDPGRNSDPSIHSAEFRSPAPPVARSPGLRGERPAPYPRHRRTIRESYGRQGFGNRADSATTATPHPDDPALPRPRRADSRRPASENTVSAPAARGTHPGRNSNPSRGSAELRSRAPPVGPILQPRRGTAGATAAATLPDAPALPRHSHRLPRPVPENTVSAPAAPTRTRSRNANPSRRRRGPLPRGRLARPRPAPGAR